MGITDLLSIGSGSLVGFSLGLLGGGGSILAVPLLVYVVGVRSTASGHRHLGAWPWRSTPSPISFPIIAPAT